MALAMEMKYDPSTQTMKVHFGEQTETKFVGLQESKKKKHHTPIGITGALAAIMALVEAVTKLQNKTSDLTKNLALLTKDYSDEENAVLQEDLKKIQNVDPKKDKDQQGKLLAAAQKQYEMDQTRFSNMQQTPQSLTEATQNAVAQYGDTTKGDYQQASALTEIWSTIH